MSSMGVCIGGLHGSNVNRLVNMECDGTRDRKICVPVRFSKNLKNSYKLSATSYKKKLFALAPHPGMLDTLPAIRVLQNFPEVKLLVPQWH